MSAAPSKDPAAHGDAPAAGRVPEFFIVGQPKAGTTALHDMLSRHPQVFMPARKEPWLFAEELLERTPPRPGGTPRTLQEYRSLFEQARPDQRVGEASPMYLWSRTAAARIAEVQPQARIVVILREPASFLRSLHKQFVEIYVETENDFPKALALEDERRQGRSMPRHTYWPQALMYSEHVRYVEQLRRYHDLFTRERVLTLLYDEFRADNEGTVRSVLRFVDVDDSHPVEVLESNLTVHVRSQRLNELVHAFSVGRGPLSRVAKSAIKALTPRELRRSALRFTKSRFVYGEPPPVDEAFMHQLRLRFRPEVEALGEYLDRDLMAIWGYDQL
jgi:hypothetical protein